MGGGGLESWIASAGTTSNSVGGCTGTRPEDDDEPVRVLLLPEPPGSVEGDPSLRARLFGLVPAVEEQLGDEFWISSPPLSKSWKGRFGAIDVDGPGCPSPTRICPIYWSGMSTGLLPPQKDGFGGVRAGSEREAKGKRGMLR